jgi:hypothetical protein
MNPHHTTPMSNPTIMMIQNRMLSSKRSNSQKLGAGQHECQAARDDGACSSPGDQRSSSHESSVNSRTKQRLVGCDQQSYESNQDYDSEEHRIPFRAVPVITRRA